MAVALRAVFPSGTTGAASLATSSGSTTVTQSITTVTNDLVIAWIGVSKATDTGMGIGATCNSVTSDGASATIHPNTQTVGFMRVFHWLAPSTGTFNVVGTATGGTPDDLGMKVMCWSGTDNTNVSYTTNVPSDTTNRTTWSVTTASIPSGGVGSWWFGAGSAFSAVDGTLIEMDGFSGISAMNDVAGGYTTSTGAQTGNATLTADWVGAIAFVLQQAGGTDATVTFPQGVLIHP